MTKYSANPLIDRQMRRLDDDKKSVARKKRQFYLTGGAAALGAAGLAAGGGAKILRSAKAGQTVARGLKRTGMSARTASRVGASMPSKAAKWEKFGNQAAKAGTVAGIGSGANWAASLPGEITAEKERIAAKEKRLKRR